MTIDDATDQLRRIFGPEQAGRLGVVETDASYLLFTVSVARRQLYVDDPCRVAELLGVGHGDVAIERARTDSIQISVRMPGAR